MFLVLTDDSAVEVFALPPRAFADLWNPLDECAGGGSLRALDHRVTDVAQRGTDQRSIREACTRRGRAPREVRVLIEVPRTHAAR